MDLKEKLMEIQVDLKAPKNLFNSFGNYAYRNAEGICNAIKPYLNKHKVVLILEDELESVGGRTYIKATATLSDCETQESLKAVAYAREPESKKGMDDSQITGAASSYARKYALNGLFLLDDTKDADTDEYVEQTGKQTSKKAERKEESASQAQKKYIYSICKEHGIDIDQLYESNNFDEKTLTKSDASNLITSLKKKFGDK